MELAPMRVVGPAFGRRMIEHVFSQGATLGHGLPGDRQTLAFEPSKTFEQVRWLASESARTSASVPALAIPMPT